MPASAFLALVVLGTAAVIGATRPDSALAASGATVDLRCEAAGAPVDLRVCLAESHLDVSREGEKTRYTAADLSTLGPPEEGRLTLDMPHNFSVKAQNTAPAPAEGQAGPAPTLHLTVRAPGGQTVHTGSATRFGWVQFYHCGPQVDPHCRDYRTPAKP